MVYTVAERATHARFHARSQNPPRMPEVSSERVVGKHGNARLVAIRDTDASVHQRRAQRVHRFVANVLNSHMKLSPPFLSLMLVENAHVRAFASVQHIHGASLSAVLRAGDVRVCHNVNHRLCGITMLWVEKSSRRLGYARAMVDAARRILVYAYVFDKTRVAFTAPTADGSRFALAYAPQNTCRSSHCEANSVRGDVQGHILVFKAESNSRGSATRVSSDQE